ncbi:LacI family DNA-binding transcriptional regulator, partial [Nocardia farcinica]|uniref:LacI family DNA-binding transcriptional regulator n=1 Tax=Nocardia farcinica TaxID=37329 RepID=UPI002454A4DC
MKEVAAAASVSVGTVSNVLNAPEKVAPATVERVLAAIDRLGFVRNDADRDPHGVFAGKFAARAQLDGARAALNFTEGGLNP